MVLSTTEISCVCSAVVVRLKKISHCLSFVAEVWVSNQQMQMIHTARPHLHLHIQRREHCSFFRNILRDLFVYRWHWWSAMQHYRAHGSSKVHIYTQNFNLQLVTGKIPDSWPLLLNMEFFLPGSQTLRTWFTVWKMCKRPGYMTLVNWHSKLLTCSWPFGSGYKFNSATTSGMYNFSSWHFAFIWHLTVRRQLGNNGWERSVNLKSLTRLGVWILHVSAMLLSNESSFMDWLGIRYYSRHTKALFTQCTLECTLWSKSVCVRVKNEFCQMCQM